MGKAPAVLALGLLLLTGVGAAPVTVIYPAPEGPKDVRFADLIELIHTALEKTRAADGDYQAVPSTMAMDESRYLAELKTGRLVNVAWSSTSAQKERDYIPIRIPLNKGLIGYRLCLTSLENEPKLARVRTLADLRNLTIGQGFGWGDIGVYQANGIQVLQASYTSLFRTLASNLYDLFPRGLNEVFPEYQANCDALPSLVVDNHLLLYYPWPYYLFVAPDHPEIARRLETGLRTMVKDGSFEKIFLKYHGEDIRKADLKHRTLITLTNPDLPPATPLADKALWFDPALEK